MAVAPYTVSVPILLPLGGEDRLPQERTTRQKGDGVTLTSALQVTVPPGSNPIFRLNLHQERKAGRLLRGRSASQLGSSDLLLLPP